MVGTQDWNSVPNDQSRVRIELSILGSRATKNRPASARVHTVYTGVHRIPSPPQGNHDGLVMGDGP